MYDTAAGLITAPQVADSPRWGIIQRSVKVATGETATRHILNTEAGLHLTLQNGVTLVAERSLPKALHGTNVVELAHDELPDALARVDAEIAEALHVDLPPLARWQPCRADYDRNDQVGDELAVRRALRQVREVQLARIGRPMVGDSGTSVSWRGRGISFKLYGKAAETPDDPRALGVLRAEATVRHLSTFRRLLDRPKGEPIRLVDVLTPEVRAQVLARFDDVFARVPMSERELSNRAFVEEILKFFPPRRAMELVGFCWVYRLHRYPSAAEIRAGRRVFPMNKSAVYRALADLRRFRQYLVDRGYERIGATDEASNPHEQGLDDLGREVLGELSDVVSRAATVGRLGEAVA